MNSVVTSSGHTIRLGSKLGGGGEGTVYEALGRADWALKIYLPGLAPEREPKIQAMISGRWSAAAKCVAFPIETLFDGHGKFVGFAMHRVAGYRPIHQLYGPSDRKTEFSKADFRFLIHAAMNVARAVAEVHNTGCVIGDINHSGVLVSDKATVTLIDSDSFQVTANGKLYRCKVGVPEFTPPELQGLNLGTVTRTITHDGFGLAVLIFQLLFMGRHPFAGSPIKGREHQLVDWIKGFRFAYSARQDITQMRPPPAVPTLVDLPPTIALAFQRAFERESIVRRPSASEWASLLHTTAREITACRADPSHFYYRAAAGCPWCRMQQQMPGLVLFIPAGTGVVFTNLDVSGLTAALRAILDPGPTPAPTVIVTAPTNLQPTAQALQAFSTRRRQLATLAAGFGAGILLIWLHPPLTLVGLAVIAGSWLIFKRLPNVTAKLQSAKKAAEDSWLAASQRWDADTGNRKFLDGRNQAAMALQELAALPNKEQRLLSDLNQKRREIQLTRFLENYRIDKATIARIGAGRRLQLASYGVETAAEVDSKRLQAIPGIGPAIAGELVSWRRSLQARFVFNPGMGVDPREIARVKAQIVSEKSSKVGEVRRLIHRLDQTTAEIKASRRSMHGALQASYRVLKQSEYDLSAVSAAGGLRPAAAVLIGFVLVGLALSTFVKSPTGTRSTDSQTQPARRETVPRAAVNEQPGVGVNNKLPHVAPAPPSGVPPPIPKQVDQMPIEQPSSGSQSEITGSSQPNVLVPYQIPILEPHSETGGVLPSVSSETASPTIPVTPQPTRDVETVEGARAVQARLVELGYLVGPADGKWGVRSRNALRAFRQKVMLGDDDQWNFETEVSLFNQSAPKLVARGSNSRPLRNLMRGLFKPRQ